MSKYEAASQLSAQAVHYQHDHNELQKCRIHKAKRNIWQIRLYKMTQQNIFVWYIRMLFL